MLRPVHAPLLSPELAPLGSWSGRGGLILGTPPLAWLSEARCPGGREGPAFPGAHNLSVVQTGRSQLSSCQVLLEAGLQRWMGRAGL